MNKLINNILLYTLPFYPIWAYIVYWVSGLHINKVFTIFLIPIALHLLLTKRIKIPKYLLFFILFTIYHLLSVYYFNIKPNNTNWVFFIFSDINVMACIALFIVENTSFNKRFIHKLNNFILTAVILSLLVSIIKIFLPEFLAPKLDEDGLVSLVNRNTSLYGAISVNSLGITFPILISLLISIFFKKRDWSIINNFILFSGILVGFLSQARYVMLSIIIVFSQLFFSRKSPFYQKIKQIIIGIISLTMIYFFLSQTGMNFDKIINERILEENTGGNSINARFDSYEIFLLKFPENPTFGVGPKTRDDVLDLLEGVPLIHVGYLSYLYYYGIIGASLLFVSLFLVLKKSWFVAKKYDFWGVFYGFLTFLIANVTFVYFNLGEPGIILAIIYLKYFDSSSNKYSKSNNINQEIIGN